MQFKIVHLNSEVSLKTNTYSLVKGADFLKVESVSSQFIEVHWLCWRFDEGNKKEHVLKDLLFPY